MSPTRKVKVSGFECTCRFCGYKWLAVGKTPPRSCSGCKRINWDAPPKPSKRQPKE